MYPFHGMVRYDPRLRMGSYSSPSNVLVDITVHTSADLFQCHRMRRALSMTKLPVKATLPASR